MNNNLEQLERVFTKNIRLKLQQIDSFKPEQRYIVYNAAIKSLKNINKDISTEIEQQREAALSNTIKKLEEAYVANNFKKGIIDVEELKIDEPIEKKVNIFDKFSAKSLVAFSCLILVVIIALKQFLPSTDFKSISQIEDDFQFPFTLPIKDKEKISVRVHGLGKIDQKQLPEQIFYSVGHDRDEKLESLDINIHEQNWLDHLQLQDGPLVLTFNLQKKTAASLELDILIRGLGKSVREQRIVTNNEEVYLFIIANKKKLPKRAKRILIRLTALSKPGKDEKNVTFSVKNLVFDKL